MIALFLLRPFLKLRISFCIFGVLLVCLIPLLPLTVRCLVLPFVFSFRTSPLTLDFRIERPLPSSRVPPWDLSLVLSLLRGAPFEPLVSCSLRDLTRKLLFLLSLATARRVGKLQAVAANVSFSGGDAFLSYLPEFRAKSESAARPIPRSFRVPSLTDFVGSLPDELLLCPVRALCVFLRRTSSLSPRPRSLFVAPRSPSRSLSKNALSYFLRSVILQSLSLAPAASSLPSTSSASRAASSAAGTSFQAHSVCSVAMSTAFAHNVPVSALLEAASWSSASVFMSLYLRDVQFKSTQGFSLGPFVAAGAVV